MAKKQKPTPECELPPEETVETPAEQEAAPAPTAEERLTAELEDMKDKYLRLAAEYDNFRRRSQKEKDAIYGDAKAKTVSEILPVIDNLSRAVDAAGAGGDDDNFRQGVEMILRQFLEILEKMDVTEIPAQGERFDPNFHNAVMHVEDEAVDESTVVEVFQKGYVMQDRVIRPAMVKVAN